MIQDTAWSPRFVPSTTATAATSGEAIAGTDTTKFITPSLLPAATSYHAGPVVNARAPRQGLVFDGTSQASVSTTAIGTTSGTIALWLTPDSISNGERYLSGTAGVQVYVDGSGKVNLYTAGGTVTTNSSLVVKKSCLIVFSINGTTATPYFNGVVDGSPTTIGSVNNFTAIGGIGSNFASGYIFPLIYNRALSAAEVVALYEAGAPSANDIPGTAAGTAIAASAGVNANNILTSYTSSAGQWQGTVPVSTSPYVRYTAGRINAGNKFRVSGTVAFSGGTLDYFGITQQGSGTGSASLPTSNGNFDVTITAHSYQASGLIDFFFAGNGVTVTVTNLSITPLGLLLAPDAAQAGSGYIWNDQSGNLAQIVLPSSGVQWNLPSVAGQRIRGTTSTNGNQQLFGASVLLPAECQITHVRARARTGTPTITIGTASGGAQIVASVALSTTWLNCTIALTGGIVSSADDIWIGSNSTDVVETDIAFQPLDF